MIRTQVIKIKQVSENRSFAFALINKQKVKETFEIDVMENRFGTICRSRAVGPLLRSTTSRAKCCRRSPTTVLRDCLKRYHLLSCIFFWWSRSLGAYHAALWPVLIKREVKWHANLYHVQVNVKPWLALGCSPLAGTAGCFTLSKLIFMSSEFGTL